MVIQTNKKKYLLEKRQEALPETVNKGIEEEEDEPYRPESDEEDSDEEEEDEEIYGSKKLRVRTKLAASKRQGGNKPIVEDELMTPRRGRGRPRKRPLPEPSPITPMTTEAGMPDTVPGADVLLLEEANHWNRNIGRPRIKNLPVPYDRIINKNLIYVYKCPIDGCWRFFVNNLGLSRHFQIYQHDAVLSNQRLPGSVEDEDSEGVGNADLEAGVTNAGLRPLLKCPIIDCHEEFYITQVDECLSHYEAYHLPPPIPGEDTHEKLDHKVLQAALKDYILLYDKLSRLAFHKPEFPDIYIEEAMHHWQFINVFESLGPSPAYKQSLLIENLRNELVPYKKDSNAIYIDQRLMIKILQVILYELMPKGLLLSTNYNDFEQGSGMTQAWEDKEWLDEITKQSILSIIHGTAPYSIEKYRKNRTSTLSSPSATSIGSGECGEVGMIICQIPGCGKVFKGIAAYRYHCHHYEHDLEILIKTSLTLRNILFSTPSPYLLEYDHVQLKFVSPPPSISGDIGSENGGLIGSQASILNSYYCWVDAVHVVHGQMDQQLPVVFSWHYMKRRGQIPIQADEFTLALDVAEDPSEIKSQLGYHKGGLAASTRREKRYSIPNLISPTPQRAQRIMPTGEADFVVGSHEHVGYDNDQANYFILPEHQTLSVDENGNYLMLQGEQ